MANQPSQQSSFSPSESAWSRAARAWNNFFFKPSDPTTLGLMRICAGIFTLYVHLAHTPDLYHFFGPTGWADQELATALRKEYATPHVSWTWTDQQAYNIVPPMERRVRQAFLLSWAQHLPADPGRRREALEYLLTLPPNPAHAGEGLAFAEYLVIRPKTETARPTSDNYRLATDDERRQLLGLLTKPTIEPVDKNQLPAFVHDLTLERRQELARSVERFIATMSRTPPGDIAMVFLHLNQQLTVPISARRETDPRSEFQRTMLFLTGQPDPNLPDDDRGPFLPNDLEERRQVLEYITKWMMDPRKVYAQGQYIFSFWFHITDPKAMAAVHVGVLAVMALFALGLWTRITSALTWIAVVSYINRCQQMVFGMDTMMNIAVLYLTIAPSGAALSLDRWLEKRRARQELEKARRERRPTAEWEAILAGPRPSALATFVTRCIQIHFCFIYAASGLSKLKGPAWWNHQAIWNTFANPEFSPVVFEPFMQFVILLSQHRWLAEILMSFGAVYTLFLEISFPFLVWRPLLRPYMIMGGVLLHTGIALLMGLTVFGLFMLVLLMSFIPPETVRRWLELGTKPTETASPTPVSRPESVRV